MSNTNYNPVDIIQNRNKLRESEKLVFFSGAGISVESPSSNPLSKDIINSLIDLFCDIAFNSTKEKKIYKGKIQNDDIRMEYIFDILEDIFDKKVLTFFEYSKDGYPNLDHLVFAKLCKQRGNQKKTTDIFTLNFDLLHENSLKQLKLRPNSLNNSADFKNFLISKKHHKYNIYHLHGSINNPNEISVNLFDIALSLQKEREKIFIEKIKDRDVFCFGYSDDDPDTFSILKKYSRHIFWYVYDEDDIPQSVKDYRSNSHNKVIFIYRHFGENFPDPKESFFYQSIVNIFNLKIDEKKFSEKYNINIGNTENEIKLKLNDYCNNLKKVFFNYPQNSKDIARYVLSCILFQQKKFDAAESLLKDININNRNDSNDYFKFLFLINQQKAVIAEAKGDPKTACDLWLKNLHIIPQKKDLQDWKNISEVKWAITKLKIWKRDICEINHLINGLITLLTRINEQDIENSFEINLMASYGFGDLLHHMVEYLPFMRFNDLDNDQEIVEQNLNNLKILNTTVMRENLIFLSIFFYRKVVSNENSRNRQYINLSRLRLIELSHALISKFNDVPIQKIIDFNNELENEEEIISDIEQYYKWAKVPNGIGNAYLTRGVSYFYKHDYQNARANLDKAKEFYMGDEVGEYKCNIYLQRMRKPDIL